ncbi:MAG: hypothetical protein KDC00_03745 [Flavobacteriales bacterium]|nr:hypothetical protein [Flavobacteriales bacterium]
MKWLLGISRMIGALLVTSLLLVSCTKEEVVEPCHDETGTVNAKGRTVPVTDTNSGEVNGLNGRGTVNPKDGGTEGGDDTDISDDGDDLSDSERRRVKPRN